MSNQVMGRTDLNEQLKQKKNNQIVEFSAGGQQVSLSMRTVREYLITGDKDRVSDEEIVAFINLCKFSGLNPWLREAYCIKYGNEPATLVVGRGAFEKRADANPMYDGSRSGIIIFNEESGVIERRDGVFWMQDEKIVGGWAEVFRKDRSHSTRSEVSFDEYAGRKSDGNLNRQWSKKPATMIRKVALVQALREAFPNSFQCMYDASEMGVDEDALDVAPVEQKTDASIPIASQSTQEQTPDKMEQIQIVGGLDDI